MVVRPGYSLIQKCTKHLQVTTLENKPAISALSADYGVSIHIPSADICVFGAQNFQSSDIPRLIENMFSFLNSSRLMYYTSFINFPIVIRLRNPFRISYFDISISPMLHLKTREKSFGGHSVSPLEGTLD